jgi:chromosome partitioning protein
MHACRKTRDNDEVRDMKTYAIATQKGGAGKSTTAVNVAAAMGEMGKRVLLVDLDPQFAATRFVGKPVADPAQSVVAVFRRDAAIAEVTIEDVCFGVDLVPSHRDLRKTEIALVTETLRETILEKALEEVARRYDFAVLDCPPHLGLLTANAMFAADHVIVPVLMDDPSCVQATAETAASVNQLRESGVDVSIAALLRTKSKPHEQVHREIDDVLPSLGLPISEVTIPSRVEFSKSIAHRSPIVVRRPDSEGSCAYRKFTQELMEA